MLVPLVYTESMVTLNYAAAVILTVLPQEQALFFRAVREDVNICRCIKRNVFNMECIHSKVESICKAKDNQVTLSNPRETG